MRKITRARYQRAIRHVEKNANAIKMQKMAETLLNNISRDVCAESCKIKGQNNNLTCSIDGAKCDEDITNVFIGNIILFIIVCLMTRMKWMILNVELKMIYLKEAIIIMLLQWQM